VIWEEYSINVERKGGWKGNNYKNEEGRIAIERTAGMPSSGTRTRINVSKRDRSRDKDCQKESHQSILRSIRATATISQLRICLE